jgi:hypothetical protein
MKERNEGNDSPPSPSLHVAGWKKLVKFAISILHCDRSGHNERRNEPDSRRKSPHFSALSLS